MKILIAVAIAISGAIFGLSLKDLPEQPRPSEIERAEERGQRSGEPNDFIRVYKSFGSGKTGKLTKTVEVLFDGTVLLKDDTNTSLGRRFLSAAKRLEIAGLIKDKNLTCAEITECGPLRSTDVNFFQIGIEKKNKIIIFKLYPHCSIPERLDELNAFLDSVAPTQK